MWLISSQASSLLVQTIGTFFLARLLGPDQYGQFAWVLVAVSAVSLATDLCVQAALVRAQAIGDRELGTLWTLSLVGGLAGAALMLLIGALSTASGVTLRPGLSSQLTFAAFIVAILAMQHVARGMLLRGAKPISVAVTDVGSSAIAVLVAIPVAVATRSAWALVVQLFALALARYLGYAVMARQRPWALHWDRRAAGTLLQFAPGLWILNMGNFVARNLDNVVVGALMGSRALGIYSRSFGLLLLPLLQVQLGIGTYALRLLSLHRDDEDQLRRDFRTMVCCIQAATFPFAAIIAVNAKFVVLIVLGPQWLDAIPLVRAFAIVGALQTANAPVGWLSVALGHRRRLAWLAVGSMSPLIAVAAGASTKNFSILALSYLLVAGLSAQLLGTHLAATTGVVTYRELLGSSGRQVLAGVLSAGPGFLMLQIVDPVWPPLAVALSATAMLACHLAGFRFLDKDGFILVSGVLRQFLPRKALVDAMETLTRRRKAPMTSGG